MSVRVLPLPAPAIGSVEDAPDGAVRIGPEDVIDAGVFRLMAFLLRHEFPPTKEVGDRVGRERGGVLI